MKTHRPTTVLAIALGSFVPLTGIGLFVLLPLHGSVRTLTQQIEQQRIAGALNALQQKQAAATLRQLERFQDAATAIDQSLLTEENALDFVTAAERVAARNNVAESMNGLKAPSAPGQQTALQILLQGSYRNLRLALADLQRLPYFLTINNMAWSAGAAGTATGAAVQLTLDATVAWK